MKLDKMKRIKLIFTTMVVIALLLITVIVCVATEGASGSTEEMITLRLSHASAVDDPVNIAAGKFAECVFKKTDGRVKIEIYPASQLGDYLSVFDEIMRGTIDMAYAPPTDQYEPDMYLSYLPFLVTSYDDLAKVYGKGGYLFNETEKLYQKLGLKFFGYGTVGFLGIGGAKKLLDENYEPIPGTLIRSSSDLLSRLTVEGLGFNVSTMSYVDVFSALQTKVIDGWMGGNTSINYLMFRDVIDYYYQYNIIMENVHLYMNQTIFENISGDDQKILSECAQKMIEQSHIDTEKVDSKYLRELENFGIKVTLFSEEKLDEFAQKIRTEVWPQIAAEKYSAVFIEELKNSF